MSTVLLIDDDAQFRRSVSRELERDGHRVLEANRCAEADSLLAFETPDLVLLEGLLADGDGVVWMKHQRRVGRRMPALFVSSIWTDPEAFALMTRDLGGAQLFRKPADPHALAERVGAMLGRASERPRPAGHATLAELRQEYSAALPAMVAELRRAFELAHQREDDPAPLASAQQLAFRMAGTAGSFGFHLVGDACCLIEQALTTLLRKDSSRSEAWDAAEQGLAAAEGAARIAREAGDAAESSGSRVLVVDDDPVFLGAAAEMAGQQLVQVMPAKTWAEALAVARSVRPDAAIIDVNLAEGQRSFPLVQELRALPGLSGLPVAFASTEDGFWPRAEAARAGASLYLRKPVDRAGFALAMRQLISQRHEARPRILLIDDDEVFVRHAVQLLSAEGMLPFSLRDPLKVFETLDECEPELLLLDVNLPGIDGFDLCRTVRTNPRWQDIPIVFLTASTGSDVRVAALAASGDGFLNKPLVRDELVACVRARVERSRRQQEKNYRDPLTGTLLRRAFTELLQAKLSDARRNHRLFSVALLDVDHFKEINDKHGHLLGDRVLARLGSILTARLRPEDVRGRWGGEEFVIATSTDAQHLVETSRRLLEEFGEVAFESDDGKSFHCSYSAGVSSFPRDGETLEDLVAAADRRLLLAKRAGRKRVLEDG